LPAASKMAAWTSQEGSSTLSGSTPLIASRQQASAWGIFKLREFEMVLKSSVEFIPHHTPKREASILMKRVGIVICTVLLYTSMAFAQEGSEPAAVRPRRINPQAETATVPAYPTAPRRRYGRRPSRRQLVPRRSRRHGRLSRRELRRERGLRGRTTSRRGSVRGRRLARGQARRLTRGERRNLRRSLHRSSRAERRALRRTTQRTTRRAVRRANRRGVSQRSVRNVRGRRVSRQEQRLSRRAERRALRRGVQLNRAARRQSGRQQRRVVYPRRRG
jgi:hypothetical protein